MIFRNFIFIIVTVLITSNSIAGVIKKKQLIQPTIKYKNGISSVLKKNYLQGKVVPGNIIVKYKKNSPSNKLLFSLNNKINPISTSISIPPNIKIKSISPLISNSKNSQINLKGNINSFVQYNNKPLSNIYVLEVDKTVNIEKTVKAFNLLPDVEYAQANHIATLRSTPNDPFYSSSGSWGQQEDDLWGLKKIKAEQSWDISKGANVIVAVVDSGLYIQHPDIAANVWKNSNEIPNNGIDDDNNGYIDDINGWNFENDNNDVTDVEGHGTHVSGIIAAVGNNATGIIGIAPKAKIMPVKLGFDDVSIVRALLYAANNGANVINNSWGFDYVISAPVVEEAIRLIYDMGITVVFAAGNLAMDVQTTTPSNMSEVIVVGASTPLDNTAFFSNFGYLDITAPGGGEADLSLLPDENAAFAGVDNILSLLAPDSFFDLPDLIINNEYLRVSGTSMSAPYVTGVIAQILSKHPDYTPEQIRQIIHNGADDISSPGFDIKTGFGRLNSFKSLQQQAPVEVLLRMGNDVIKELSLDIVGTIKGTDLVSWVLDYGVGSTPTKWIKISSGSNSINNNLITQWDATELPEKENVLRLTAVDKKGKQYVDYHPIYVDRIELTTPERSDFNLISKYIYKTGSKIELSGTVNSGNFLNYHFEIEQIKSISDTPEVKNIPIKNAVVELTNGGTSRIQNGILGVWDTSNIETAGRYKVNLIVNTAQGQFSESKTALIDPWIKSGYPIVTSGEPALDTWISTYRKGMQLIDINQDGKKELAFTSENLINFFDNTGKNISGWPVDYYTNPVTSGMSQVPQTIADLDNDGEYEVITSNTSGYLFVWSENGKIKDGWPIAIETNKSGIITVADINGNLSKEIIIVSNGKLIVYDLNGKILNGFPVQISDIFLYTQPIIGDMNGDGLKEIAVFDRNQDPQKLHIYQSNGEILPGWPITFQQNNNFINPESMPTMADINKDGKDELIFGDESGLMHVFLEDGNELKGWPIKTTMPGLNSAVVADFDQDGNLDIIVSSNRKMINAPEGLYTEAKIFVWNNDGLPFPQWPITVKDFGNPFASGFSEAMVADIDNDNQLEIVVTGHPTREHTSVRAFEVNASEILSEEYPKPLLHETTSTSSVAIADVDGDGKMELAAADIFGKLYLWDTTVPATINAPWSMSMNNNAHTRNALNVQSLTNEFIDMIPHNRTVQKGNYFTIKFALRNNFDKVVNNFKLEYEFDKSALEIISIHNSTEAISKFDNTKGNFKINWNEIPEGKIISATIRIKTKSIGATEITADTIKFNIDKNINSLSGNDISVTITP
ncbi:MAG: S8 family serine peptidase [Thiohalomonadales bacterium]